MARAAYNAAVYPAGPDPMMMTSWTALFPALLVALLVADSAAVTVRSSPLTPRGARTGQPILGPEDSPADSPQDGPEDRNPNASPGQHAGTRSVCEGSAVPSELPTESADLRCAAHPARPAVDECPVCGRPRCGADARLAPGGGCLQCRGKLETAVAPPDFQRDLGRLIAGTLAALLLAELLAPVVSEYVGAAWFAEITPFLLGLACAVAAAAAARTHGHGRLDIAVRAIGGLAGVLGTALAFRLVPGSLSPFHPAGTVLPPYGCALLGAAVSRLFR